MPSGPVRQTSIQRILTYNSGYFLAEITVNSPRKLSISLSKRMCEYSKYLKNSLFNFEKRSTDVQRTNCVSFSTPRASVVRKVCRISRYIVSKFTRIHDKSDTFCLATDPSDLSRCTCRSLRHHMQ